jgi:hypothetical protein
MDHHTCFLSWNLWLCEGTNFTVIIHESLCWSLVIGLLYINFVYLPYYINLFSGVNWHHHCWWWRLQVMLLFPGSMCIMTCSGGKKYSCEKTDRSSTCSMHRFLFEFAGFWNGLLLLNSISAIFIVLLEGMKVMCTIIYSHLCSELNKAINMWIQFRCLGYIWLLCCVVSDVKFVCWVLGNIYWFRKKIYFLWSEK